MNRITDFNSVLEIAFGLNVLFYVFELLPHVEERLKLIEERTNELIREKIQATGNTEVFPIQFVVGTKHAGYKCIFTSLSLIISVAILTVILIGSFNPGAQISTSWLGLLLVVAYSVPVIAFRFHRRNEHLLLASNDHLEYQINEARSSARIFQSK